MTAVANLNPIMSGYSYVAPQDPEARIGLVGGCRLISGVEFTRPSDTTAYAALDALSDSTSAPTVVMTFASIARTASGTGRIVRALLQTDQATNTSAYNLFLYSAAPTAINDNAACTVLYANRASYLGVIAFAAAATAGSGSDMAYSLNSTITLPFAGQAATTLYGLLQTVGGFTPASAQKFRVSLMSECD